MKLWRSSPARESDERASLSPRAGPPSIIGDPPTQRPLALARTAARGALLLLAPALLGAQSAAGVLAGRVTARADTGLAGPVAGAAVTVQGTALGATTDADRRFVIPRVPAGTATVRLRLQG